MDRPKLEAVPHIPLRRFLLPAIAALAALAWVGYDAHIAPKQNPLRQKLAALRDDGSADAPLGFSPLMSDVMVVRNALLRSMQQGHPRRLSPSQDRLLADCLSGPVDERSQSEALDTLLLAHRAGVLSPAEVRIAEAECLNVLSRTPPQMVRLEAARFLAHSRTPRAIAALRRLQNDPVSKIRAAANQGRLDAVPPR